MRIYGNRKTETRLTVRTPDGAWSVFCFVRGHRKWLLSHVVDNCSEDEAKRVEDEWNVSAMIVQRKIQSQSTSKGETYNG